MALRCGAIGPAGIPRDVQTHGAIRNLDCEYCFFLSKDELYPGNGFRMDAEVHEAYVGQLLAAGVLPEHPRAAAGVRRALAGRAEHPAATSAH